MSSRFAPASATIEHRFDGSIVLRHGLPAAPYDRQIGEWLRRWSEAAPNRLFLGAWGANRIFSGLTYGEARKACDSLSQALLDRGLDAERPLALLSEKSLSHCLLTLAALQVGIPVAPISPTYALRREAHGRLAACLKAATPGMVFVERCEPFSEALDMLGSEVEILYAFGDTTRRNATSMPEMLKTRSGEAVDRAFLAVDPDAPAKILFTSGSTGSPKPAVNTHRMMCSNAAAQAQLYPFLKARPPVIVDWQPWHHCGGSNFNFHAALSNGGTYFIDSGKPTTPDAFEPTLHALREVAPTVHFNVPQGYEMLAFHLERDEHLRRRFFSQLECMFYSAAGMPLDLWHRLAALAESVGGVPVPMVSCYGMTEMAPMHTSLHWHETRPGFIGLPIPGAEVKLVPTHDKLELRARGPNVTPGYFRAPELTAAAFDDEGWYLSGDAVRLADPNDPSRGLVFDGRLSEEFKLTTGTFVPVGALRTAVVASSPFIADALIVGEGRSEVGALLILNLKEGRERLGEPKLALEDMHRHPQVHADIRAGLARHNSENSVSSRRIALALPILDVPSLSKGETTDKGYINQRLAVSRRAELVATLYDSKNRQVIRLT